MKTKIKKNLIVISCLVIILIICTSCSEIKDEVTDTITDISNKTDFSDVITNYINNLVDYIKYILQI